MLAQLQRPSMVNFCKRLQFTLFTNYGNIFTISPYHVLWPVPTPSIQANVDGVINQNKGYVGYEKNVPPLTKIE